MQHPWGRAALYGLFAVGWLTVLATTFLINHFDLFGLRQVWLYCRGREYKSLGWPYRIIRHPLYIGWMTAFWATPTITIAHLVFAIGTTVYMLVAIVFEERDLVRHFGRNYEQYRENVPKLIPRILATRPRATSDEAGAVATGQGRR